MGFTQIDLRHYMNNQGFTRGNQVGDLDGMGNSMALDQINDQGPEFYDVTFQFPETHKGFDNLTLEEQVISVPPGKYKRIHMLQTSDMGELQERLVCVFADGERREVSLRMKSWVTTEQQVENVACWTPEINVTLEQFGISNCRGKIWYNSLAIDGEKELVQLELSDNPCMHIFAITLED